MQARRDGRSWRIGTAEEVAWLRRANYPYPSVTAAIPPVFEAYATFYDFDGVDVATQERALVHQLADSTPDQPWWWLGFLETGAHDVVFPAAPRVRLYWDWPYVLVLAGPEQALTWRTGHMRAAYGTLPDLFFPADRRWLVSALWDDTWTCFGGSAALVEVLEKNPLIAAHRVQPGEDGKPPGAIRD